MTGLPPWSEMAVVGHVARAHGIRGQVVLHAETDFPDTRFEPGSVVYRRRDGTVEPLTVESLRFHRGQPIVGFEGITTMTEAEELAGLELRVPVEALEKLPAGSFYVHDLVGCRVDTTAGEMVGTVERVSGEGGASHLVVNGPAGEVLIPLAADICRDVDIARKAIVIEAPEGLLDLNRREHELSRRERREAERERRRRGGSSR